MRQSDSINMPVTINYWDLVRNMSNDAKRNLIAVLQKSLKSSEMEIDKDTMSFADAKEFLSKHKLSSQNVPADFNGMRDEVNEKYI